jgi:hypothetical protein
MAVGGVVGGVAVLVLVLAGTSGLRAAELTFSVGALALGFGLLGWSGSVMAGRGVEEMQEHLDTSSDWTEAKSRRAMARIGGFGGGLMAGSAAVELVAFGA